MKILLEGMNQSRIIKEKTSDGTNWYIEGTMIQCDVMNRNKRIYPLDVMQESVANYKRDFFDNDQAVGELEHPCERLQVDSNLISHRIIQLEQEGKNFWAKALVLNTPKGRVLQSLLEGGVKTAVSTRGGGETRPIPGGEKVLPGFKMYAIDSVFNPSAQSAYMDALMEGEKFVWDANDKDTIYLESIRDKLKKTSSRMLQEQKIQSLAAFINRLK